MNPYAHVFLAEAGSNAARDFLLQALRSPDFPRKFRSRAQSLHKRVVSLDSTLERLSERARAALRVKSARGNNADPVQNLSWAIVGLDNALSELKLVAKQDPSQASLVREAQLLHYELESLLSEVREYLESLHPLDWAGEAYEDFTKNLPSFPSFSFGRPALVASHKVAGWWETEAGNLIGDSPSDFMSDAVDEIRETYRKHVGREPTMEELRGTLDFVTGPARNRGGLAEAAEASPLRVARNKAQKDVGHGGLDEWFSGHGGGEGEARWGDWVAISPVEKKVKKELADGTVKKETVYPGEIVGPCGISEDPNWDDLTNKGKDPLKCMPRQKAHDMPKSERAELAREKMRAEKKDRGEGKGTTHTRTFEKESAMILAGENEPTDPKLWEKAKAKAKSRYDKWPSAYAVGHALKIYKEDGGGWRKTSHVQRGSEKVR
jgi:hypothetical protein